MVVLTNFPPPTDGIRHQEVNTEAYIQAKNYGKGTLYIAESRVSWLGDDGQGFSLEYPGISLHAVSRDVVAFPQECLYLMLDAVLPDDTVNEDDSTEEEHEETRITEVRFVPANKDSLSDMFQAMNDCQALHPDENESNSDEDIYDDAEDDDSFIPNSVDIDLYQGDPITGQPVVHLENGHPTGLNSGSTEEPMDVGQFDDAEPEH